MPRRPIRSWLYAPGNNARLLSRVFDAGADAVILDLEDAVPAAEKITARAMVAQAIDAHVSHSSPAVWVRINHPAGTLAAADVEAVVRPGLDGVRVPKIESADEVIAVAGWLDAAERRAGFTPGQLNLVCGIESALGVHRALEIAAASPRVLGLAFGGVDFSRDVAADDGSDGVSTLYARSALVIASRVAGIGQPIDGVYRELQNEVGLEHSTRQGKRLGFFGRSAIHPRQIATIHAVYTPTPDEVARAREVIASARSAESTGSGALQSSTGEFVDAPVVRRAEAVLQLAEDLAR